jgi:hypothetical protein
VRWLPAIAAAAVLGLVVLAGVSGRGGSEAPGAAPATTPGVSLDPSDTGMTVPPSTLDPVVIATDPAVTKTQLTQALGPGMVGDEVKWVQQRLTDLGFQPGPVDGVYGLGTRQAVWAFEKLVLGVPYDQPRGVVTNAMWQTMQEEITIQPRRTETTSTHVEVYLDKQVLIVFQGRTAAFITHISSGELNPDGTPKTFCEEVTIDTDEEGRILPEPVTKGICAEAKTPGGVFRFTWRYPGKRVGPLGGMYDPVYFNYGIAVHGAEKVPLQPASHGCIRIPKFLSTVFPTLVKRGDQIFVWDGKKEPEQQSKRDSLPSFNRPDPNYTTTTSSTTTTTVPATTTTKPPTTTTTKPPTTTTSTTTTSSTTTTAAP